MHGAGDDIRCSVVEGIATITICRENKRNALAQRHFIELVRLLRNLEGDENVRVIVLSGAGSRAFCAGADLSDDERFFERIGDHPTTGLGDLLRCAWCLSKPLIGRINGHCYAGGMGLLAACDLAISSDEARFALPEITLGLFPYVVVAGLRAKIGDAFLTELALTAAPIDARRAEQMGLITNCVPADRLDEAVAELATRLAAMNRAAMKHGRPFLRELSYQDFNQAISAAELLTRQLAESRARERSAPI